MSEPTGEAVATSDLGAESVQTMARTQGVIDIDEEMATRIAAGALSAVAAVLASRRGSMFDREPSAFLAELDLLGLAHDEQ